MEIVKEKNKLVHDVVHPEVIKTNYTPKLEKAPTGEKIIIDPLEDIFNHSQTTRQAKKLFSNGFVKYPY